MKVLYPFLILASISQAALHHYEEANSAGYAQGELVHTVILSLKGRGKLKNGKTKIIELLVTLSEIKVTQRLIVSTKASTNDTRAQQDYDLMVLQMSFKRPGGIRIHL